MRMYKEQLYLTVIVVVIALVTDVAGIDWDDWILAIIWFVGVVVIQIAKMSK